MKNTTTSTRDAQKGHQIETMDIFLSSERRAEIVYNEACNSYGKYRIYISKHGRMVRIPKGVPFPV